MQAGGREKCCGDRPEQMDPGSLRRTKTCSWPIDQEDRLAVPTECTIDFASFSPCFPLFPSSAALPRTPQRVFIWDLDETIIVFHSLLTGSYANRYGRVSDIRLRQ